MIKKEVSRREESKHDAQCQLGLKSRFCYAVNILWKNRGQH